MSSFESDSMHLSGTSLEDLRQYTDVLLGAAELADALDSHESTASDRFFRVADPRVMDLIEVPDVITEVIGYDKKIDAVVFQSTIRKIEAETLVNSCIRLEYNDDDYVLIQKSGDQYVALFTDENVMPISVTAEMASDIIARITHPSNDPSFSDFANIDDPDRVNEICDTLENVDMATVISERIYEIDSTHQVITESKDGKLVMCEIVEFCDDQEIPLALMVEFKHFSTASSLYQTTPDGSKELIMDVVDLERFKIIIAELLEKITPQTELKGFLE